MKETDRTAPWECPTGTAATAAIPPAGPCPRVLARGTKGGGERAHRALGVHRRVLTTGTGVTLQHDTTHGSVLRDTHPSGLSVVQVAPHTHRPREQLHTRHTQVCGASAHLPERRC